MRILHKQQPLPPLAGPRLEPHPFRGAGAVPDQAASAPLVPGSRRQRGLEARRAALAAETRGKADAATAVGEGRLQGSGLHDAFEFRQLGKEDFEQFEALLRYAFNALDASKVGIGHAVGNAASEHIIKKLGFTLLTQRTKVVFLSGGRVLDDKIYARISLYGLPPLDVTWGVAAKTE